MIRFRYKPVAASRHCLNKLRAAGSFTECLAQERDVLSQISLFDKGVWPDSLHQIVLRDDLSAMLNEGNENIENLRRERNKLTFAQQEAFRNIKAEATELVTLIALLIQLKPAFEKYL